MFLCVNLCNDCVLYSKVHNCMELYTQEVFLDVQAERENYPLEG